jgi:MoaA/NifB/PqqE/SkfB family radical SAM enzyme
VYDILHRCNLACIGCGTNAIFINALCVKDASPTLVEIEKVFKKIKCYQEKTKKSVFINIGGGEPFLRFDILDVLKIAAEYFSPSSVGVDTNGSLPNSFELISEALPYVSFLGISIDGLESYHNWWSGNSKINAFRNSTTVAKKLCDNPEWQKKIEISSVATTKNYADIPALIEFLSGLGIKNYSVHRAMPVGRMANRIDLIPNAEQYLDLLVSMIETARNHQMNVHLHHSIESIYATLLLNLKTFLPDKIGNPDMASSIGIEPEGLVVFDPWCTTGTWKMLNAGNILDENINLYDLLETKNGSILDTAKVYTAPNVRCNCCRHECSGGSRIAAAVNYLHNIDSEITITDIYGAMTEVDPVCPLYEKEM